MLNTLTKEELEDNSNRKGNRGTNWFQRKSAYLDAISKTAMATRYYPEFNDAVILKKKFEVQVTAIHNTPLRFQKNRKGWMGCCGWVFYKNFT